MSSPIKASFKTEFFPLLLIVLSFVSGFYFYQHFPAQVATHWNFRGEINGYSSPFLAAFLLPLMMGGMYLLFMFLPYLDPRRDQYAAFAATYRQFKDLIISVLFILFLMVGFNGVGHKINIGFWTPILIGALFVGIGLLLNKIKMNWFMGIRTPWTLSSETVWNKTHEVSGRVFSLAGLLLAATVLAPAGGKIVLFILSIAVLVLALPAYSYILYAREKKEKK